jgi:hypothetical protein
MYKNIKQSFYKRPIFILGIALILLILGTIISEATNTTHLFHSKQAIKPQVTASELTKGESTPKTSPEPSTKVVNGQTSNSTSNVGAQPGDAKNTQATDTTVIAPTGNFVSAHKNISGSTSLSSVCNTTMGASCQITFTSAGSSKSLPAQTTDRGGSTFWSSWTPDSVGLTSGSWKVQAIATLNGQSQTSTDALELEIN